jgi:hypothetical protein
MSTRLDLTWALGETWTLPVDCFKADGTPLTPITSARFSIENFMGDDVLVAMSEPIIMIADPRVTVNIPTEDQGDFAPGLYLIALFVTDGNNAISRQVNGTVLLV